MQQRQETGLGLARVVKLMAGWVQVGEGMGGDYFVPFREFPGRWKERADHEGSKCIMV